MNPLNEHQKTVIAEAHDRSLTRGGLSLPLGFGKTRTSVCMGLSYRSGPIIVVASKTLMASWLSEIPKAFGDILKFEVLHSDYIKSIESWKPKHDTQLVLTTPEVLSAAYKQYNLDDRFLHYNIPEEFGPTILEYNTPNSNMLPPETSGIGFVYSIVWGCLIVDEIQNCNNILRDKCRAIACISSPNRWGLSGTMFDEPKTERFLGYFTMLHIKGPRSLPDMKSYLKSSDFKGLKQYIIHRKENAEFKIRPKYTEEIVIHDLYPVENRIFQASREVLIELSDTVKKLKEEKDDEFRRFSAYLLAMITYVRQFLICPVIPIASIYCDIADFEERSQLSKIVEQRFRKIGIEDWLEDENSIMSSRFKNLIEKVEKHEDERVIIFSCFRTPLTLMQDILSESGRDTFTISANMNTVIRSKTIADFEISSNGIMLLPYSIGAEGLNLQCASVVMLMDLWWNSAKIQQAIGRIFRPGQKASEIFIYIFVSNTGMEQKMIEKNSIKNEILKELQEGSTNKKIPKMHVNQIIEIINSESNAEALRKLRKE